MVRHNNLYPEIYDFCKLHEAYQNARKGKRDRDEVIRYTRRLEENLIITQNQLIWKSYKVSPYRQFYVHEPKKRLIMALPFRDRVVQWSIFQTINPIIEKRLIKDSYACRENKGTHKAVERVQYWLQQYKYQEQQPYALKLDVKKYFYRISHERLLKMLHKITKDKELMWLLETIIQCDTDFGLNIDDTGFDGDLIPGVGIPIGNLTSQLFANLYLNELDQFAKHKLRANHYIRYMDDSMILSNNKKELWDHKQRIEEFLHENLKLNLNSKTCIRSLNQGVDWVGYRVFPTHIKLRKSTAKRMKKRLKYMTKLYKMGEAPYQDLNASLQSYMGMMKHCNSYNLKEKLTKTLNEALGVADGKKEEEKKIKPPRR